MKRFVKSLWKNFKRDFEQLEENISFAKEEVDEEIKLASEQKNQRIYECLQIESAEAHVQRSQQLIEMKENQIFRSQQTLALKKTEELRIQKIIKEEGVQRSGTIISQLWLSFLQIVQENVFADGSSIMIILEAKTKHSECAFRALPLGSSRERNLMSGMKRFHQRAFGVQELVSRIHAKFCPFCTFLLEQC